MRNDTGLELLRELARKTAEHDRCALMQEINGAGCVDLGCGECRGLALKKIADRIEREQDEAADLVEEHGGMRSIEAELVIGERISDAYRALHDSVERLAAPDKGGLPDDDLLALIEKRLMPEGMEWPKVDGKPVDFRTHYKPSLGVLEAVGIYSNGACEVMSHDGIIKGISQIHIASSKVLDADGVEIRVGDEVWSTAGEFDGKRTVKSVHHDDGEPPYALFEEGCEPWSCLCCHLTHRAPVLAADGKPLREGETVWDVQGNGPYEVEGINSDGTVRIKGNDYDYFGDDFTHERPDSWERLEDDAGKGSCDYFGCDADGCHGCPAYDWNTARGGNGCGNAKMRDLVRRAKKLAGVE